MEHSGMPKINRKKKKRKRTVISSEEIDRLENEFLKDPRPDRLTKMDLANEMGKAETVISTWFQNRRAREKKMAKLGAARGSSLVYTEPPAQPLEQQPLNLSLKDNTDGRTMVEDLPLEKSMQSVSFGRLIRMAAAGECGILSLDCPEIQEAMLDACNGIMLKDSRLVYHPTFGFDIESFTD